jgi:preprotein translocase subunit YajC
VSAVDGDDVILEVAPGVDVRYMRRAIMEVVSEGDAPEPVDDEAEDYDEAEGYDDDDVHDSEADPSDEHEDATSAADGLAESHDEELAKSDKDNVF